MLTQLISVLSTSISWDTLTQDPTRHEDIDIYWPKCWRYPNINHCMRQGGCWRCKNQVGSADTWPRSNNLYVKITHTDRDATNKPANLGTLFTSPQSWILTQTQPFWQIQPPLFLIVFGQIDVLGVKTLISSSQTKLYHHIYLISP